MKSTIGTITLDCMARRPAQEKPFYGWRLSVRRAELNHKSGLDIENETNGVIYQKLLSRIENGKKPLPELDVIQLKALAKAMGWTLIELQKETKVDLGLTEQYKSEESVITNLEYVIKEVISLAAANLEGVYSDEDVIDRIWIPREVDRATSVAVRVVGNSMDSDAPDAIKDGDDVLIDLTLRDIVPDKIFVIAIIGDGVVIKRAKRFPDGSVWLVSDNPNYRPFRPDEAVIIGQAYWRLPRGHKL